jgi:hypothetical protein
MHPDKTIFPRKLQAQNEEEAIRSTIYSRTKKIRTESDLEIPFLTINSALTQALRTAERRGHLSIGLDNAEENLRKEQQGILMMEKKQGLLIGKRISRLILLANDGTERFYRNVERLAKEHRSRLLVCRLDIPGSEIGRILFGEERNIKLLLIAHKDSVTLFFQTFIKNKAV